MQNVWKQERNSWVQMNVLKEQNPFVLFNHVEANKSHDHPDFKWSKLMKDKQLAVNVNNFQAFAAKCHQAQKHKFGTLMPNLSAHAMCLDKINDTNLWQEAITKKLESIKEMWTFCGLGEGEKTPEGHSMVPCHITMDCKFDGGHKARLDCGGNKTPDAPPEEVHSGVVSMETIGMAFVLASMNNLQVCAADTSTAFLCGKTREKVCIKAGKEFGEHAGKMLLFHKGTCGL